MVELAKQQLVITAIGEDQAGVVSALTQLVSDCHCNITDSRIAILGNELTFIMLLNGDMAAISRVEHLLPNKGMELGLLTMMKRTSSHTEEQFGGGYTLEYVGIDTPGTLSQITGYFAEHNISICSLKSDTYEQENTIQMRCELEFNVPQELDIDAFKVSFEALSQRLEIDYIFRRIR
ncbi:glycine cleavage system protein R [Pseudoalteromonas pernae]|uniref:glycine cleavage system protein R n=1 Tax=Pseudoalteromonas pernae TaxID=3118054 RepID=UPI0032423379